MSSETSTDSILAIVKTIRESKVVNKAQHFETIYGNFKTKYPTLYAKACSNDKLDVANLSFMLGMLQKMNNENVTQYDASAEVSPNALETSISRLRSLLAGANASVELRTVRGVGYALGEKDAA